MTRWQVTRFAVVSLVVASIQTSALERLLLFGVGSLVLPVWLILAVSRRLPATNAAIAGFGAGMAWDALSISSFGRYALALSGMAAAASLTAAWTETPRSRSRFLRRLVQLTVATVWLWWVSAMAGETFPVISGSTLAGLALASAIGAAVTGPGGRLERIGLGGRTAWDEPDRSTDWVDRRSGLFPVPARADVEPEAA